jgi:hypothetical protein
MAIGSKKRPAKRASSMAKEADLGVGRRGGFIFWHVAAEANTKAWRYRSKSVHFRGRARIAEHRRWHQKTADTTATKTEKNKLLV